MKSNSRSSAAIGCSYLFKNSFINSSEYSDTFRIFKFFVFSYILAQSKYSGALAILAIFWFNVNILALSKYSITCNLLNEILRLHLLIIYGWRISFKLSHVITFIYIAAL